MKRFAKILSVSTVCVGVSAGAAMADKLDDIIAAGVLRCAVMLDFAPMGFRNEAHEPVGFDVDTCNDLAAALGVTAEIVETPLIDRIPALLSGRADVAVASASDTLERAKTIGFTVPYFAFTSVILARSDAGITTYDDLKGKVVGTPAGSAEGIALQADVTQWTADGSGGEYKGFQSQADTYLAMSQGQIVATVLPSTLAAAAVEQNPGFTVVGDAPYVIDYVGLMAPRGEYGLLNYLDLFINQQVRTGRYDELYRQWIGGEPASLTVPNVYR
ncbi:transporter substrate-binding domain-containing protein [Pseudomonas sp. GX19020]|uniref:transporter substrate-binding domain-containing protein n=1 Tax=Pseudomonas sp. GX19020 TaxID=2942277 RepID=UPI00201A014E|nr:transporter substrate-binding domain-containing protein [Pseudomonas sp. GX19020]MCL4069436.1 transporter substrate-binding domain-containing protein [Pseudomonas sp. GX19020]